MCDRTTTGMALCNLNIFVISLFTLGFVFHLSQGFKVTQSQMDNLPIIACEHDAQGAELKDVRLYRTDTVPKQELCQKEQTCKHVILFWINATKCAFFLYNLEPEERMFECMITLDINGTDIDRTGAPAISLKGEMYKNTCPPPPPPPSPFHFNELAWFQTGLLALLFLVSCTIIYVYRRKEKTAKNLMKNSTYVTMKAC